jgi:hypothetical protein
MSYAQPKQYFAATHRAVANADAIEWEELPSLAGSLAHRLVRRGQPQARGANDSEFGGGATGFGSVWDNTMPAALDPAPVSQPFFEPLAGLSTREVNEPEIFRHFFGDRAVVA